MEVKSISQHCLERFVERKGETYGKNSSIKALNKLTELLKNSIKIDKFRYYCDGWIMVVKKKEMRTAYKVKSFNQMDLVYEAHRRIKELDDKG